jgi:hypothetical protein
VVAIDVWRSGAGRVVVFLLPEVGHDLQIEFLATEKPPLRKASSRHVPIVQWFHDMSFMMVYINK